MVALGYWEPGWAWERRKPLWSREQSYQSMDEDIQVNTVVPELRFRSDHTVAELLTHDVVLRGDGVVLRPMTEADWDLLLMWNNDAEVMEFADHDEFKETTLEEVQAHLPLDFYPRHCFIIEVAECPVGEYWLQRMNLERIVDRQPQPQRESS